MKWLSDSMGLPRYGLAIFMTGGVVVVWFVGFDALWAIATVLTVVTVGAAFTSLGAEEELEWDRPGFEPRRGIRIDVTALAKSLAACTRLAQPSAIRLLCAPFITEREDRQSRSLATRRMQALVAAELQSRGLDPDDLSEDGPVVRLFGRDAVTILRSTDDNRITAAAIDRCLEAVEHLHAETHPSS